VRNKNPISGAGPLVFKGILFFLADQRYSVEYPNFLPIQTNQLNFNLFSLLIKGSAMPNGPFSLPEAQGHTPSLSQRGERCCMLLCLLLVQKFAGGDKFTNQGFRNWHSVVKFFFVLLCILNAQP
jgi:hypothetical protein